MAAEAGRVLIVEARFYAEIADALTAGAEAELDKAGIASERIDVPGVFEIPAAMQMAYDANPDYLGFLSLGCVIRGETDHYDHICREVSRALMDFSTLERVAHGFGILTCENRDQAWERADPGQRDIGGRAAAACLRMSEIKRTHPPVGP